MAADPLRCGAAGPARRARDRCRGIAALAAGFAISRFRFERRTRDLALAVAFSLFAVASLGFSMVPTVLGDPALAVFDTWAALGTRVLAAAAFCTAALLPPWRGRPATGRWVAMGTAVLVMLVAAGAFALAGRVPPGVGLIDLRAPVTPALFEAHPALAAAQLAQLILNAVAFVGFQRRAQREADPEAALLALAAIFAAFARLHYLLYPSLYADVVYSGDLFRLAFYATVLAAAFLELQRRYRQAAELTALKERRSLAHDLHDGLAQELAFIATKAGSLARNPSAPAGLREVVSAAERALDESRRAITALTAATALPAAAVIAQAAEEVAARFGARLRLEVGDDEEMPLTSAQREMLIRVTREAVANAARHAGAQVITVSLSNEHGVRLIISDDGCGFDPEHASRSGQRFGLTSMRERAEAAGGRFRLTSTPGQGTRVEVQLP